MATPPASGDSCFSLVQDWLSHLTINFPPSSHLHAAAGLLQSLLCQNLTVEQFQPGHLVCALLVTPEVANACGTLHGGAIGGLVELMACTAIKSVAGPKDAVVSDINISYITGSRIKDEVEFEAKVLRLGRNVAVAAVDACDRKSRKAAVQGRVTMCFGQVSKL